MAGICIKKRRYRDVARKVPDHSDRGDPHPGRGGPRGQGQEPDQIPQVWQGQEPDQIPQVWQGHETRAGTVLHGKNRTIGDMEKNKGSYYINMSKNRYAIDKDW
jgi:hypothetical protein